MLRLQVPDNALMMDPQTRPNRRRQSDNSMEEPLDISTDTNGSCRGRPETPRKIEGKRSSSLWGMDRRGRRKKEMEEDTFPTGAVASMKAKYLEASTRPERAVFKPKKATAEPEKRAAPLRRSVQKNRSRSLTQLEQRKNQGTRPSNAKCTDEKAKMAEIPIKTAKPSKRTSPTRGRVQRTRSRSLTQLDQRKNKQQGKRGSWIKQGGSWSHKKASEQNAEQGTSCLDKSEPVQIAAPTRRNVQRMRSSSLTQLDKREQKNRGRRESNETGTEEEPIRASIKEIAKKRPRQRPAPSQRNVQRTRSRSLTQLDQIKNQPQGKKGAWVKQGGSWFRGKQIVAAPEETKVPERRPPSPLKAPRGRPAPPRDAKPLRSRSSTARKPTKPTSFLQSRASLQITANKSLLTEAPSLRRVQRTRSRSLTSLRKEKAQDGTTHSYLAYAHPKWVPLTVRRATKIQKIVRGFLVRRKALQVRCATRLQVVVRVYLVKLNILKQQCATKIQAIVRRFLGRLHWITRKPWLRKKQIHRQKEIELALIEREKRSAMLGFKYEIDDMEDSKEKQMLALRKERASLEKQILMEIDTESTIRMEINNAKAERQRHLDRQRTSSIVTMVQATIATSSHDEKKGAKKRIKAYKKEIKSVKRELHAVQYSLDEEKQGKQRIAKCMRAIIGKIQRTKDMDYNLVDYLIKYSGIEY